MSLLNGILANGTAMSDHRPWPRAIVDEETWKRAATDMAEGRLSLLGLWGEAQAVHMAVREETANAYAVLSLASPGGRYPSVAQFHAPPSGPEA